MIRSMTALTVALAAGVAQAGIIAPFTETFDTGNESWGDGASNPASWSDGVITTSADLDTVGPFGGLVIFRAEEGLGSSGNAFAGNYIASGIDTLSFDVRHDGGVAVPFIVRFAAALNSPAFVLFSPIEVQSGVWTTLTFDISPDSPFYIPAGGTYESVAPQVSRVQILADRPAGLDESLVVNFELDNVSITPAPSAMALLGLGGLVAARRRR